MKTKLVIPNELDDEFIFDDEQIPQDVKMKSDNLNKDSQVIYLGRLVNKRHFRAFVYSDSGTKLVNSYDEFEKAIATGVWFESKDALLNSKAVSKKKIDEPVSNVKKKVKAKIKIDDIDGDYPHEVIEYGTDR